MVRRESGLVVPEMRINERTAPPARFGAGIRGWVDWEFVDRRGRVADGGQCRNMWLNQGLDELAVPASGVSILGRGNQSGSGAALYGVTHAVVGTGSTAVDPTQTTLAAELARSNTVLSGSVSATRIANGVYQLTKTWVFDFGQANGNLTEWGVARAASLGLLTRALFLDPLDNPITITKTSDYQLRLAYTLEMTLTPVIATAATVVITGVGTVNGDAMLIAGTQGGGMNDLVFFNDWSAGGADPQAGLTTDTTFTYLGAQAWASGSAGSNVNTPSTYVPGTYERTCSHTWGVSNGNVAGIRTIAGSGYQSGANRITGFAFLLDSGDAFTKTGSNQLILNDLFTVAWARA